MTLFAFTYANACTAMKGFDTDKNKKLEEEEREKLVNYIEVISSPKPNLYNVFSYNSSFAEYFEKRQCG